MSVRTISREVGRNVFRWDFLASLLIAAAFLASVLRSDRPLNQATAPLGVAVSLGIALALGAGVAGRWLSDSTKDDGLGEIIRAINPTGRLVQRPFLVVTVVGIATSLCGALLLVAGDGLSRSWAAWAYAAEVFLVSYGLLGMLDVILLGFRHQSRQAVLRALREQEQRRKAT